ncbi:type II secretion system F family protein [Candidatus Hydrogenedentota bacterium]
MKLFSAIKKLMSTHVAEFRIPLPHPFIWFFGNVMYSARSKRRKVLMEFNETMTLVSESGQPLAEGLRRTFLDMKYSKARSVGYRTLGNLQQGWSIADAVDIQSWFFPRFYRDLVRVGYETARLPEMFKSLGKFLENSQAMLNYLIRSIFYPVLVIGCFAFPIIALIMIKVIPTFKEVFAEFENEMPWLTVKLIDTGRWVNYRFYELILPLIFLVLIALPIVIERVGSSSMCHWIALRIPFVRRIAQLHFGAWAARILSMLLKTGLPLDEALERASTFSMGGLHRKDFKRYAEGVRNGMTLADCIKEKSSFTETFQWYASMGESTGDLTNTLEKCADAYSERLRHFFAVAKQVLDPMWVLGLSLVVGWIVIACYSPLFSLIDELSQWGF